MNTTHLQPIIRQYRHIYQTLLLVIIIITSLITMTACGSNSNRPPSHLQIEVKTNKSSVSTSNTLTYTISYSNIANAPSIRNELLLEIDSKDLNIILSEDISLLRQNEKLIISKDNNRLLFVVDDIPPHSDIQQNKEINLNFIFVGSTSKRNTCNLDFTASISGINKDTNLRTVNTVNYNSVKIDECIPLTPAPTVNSIQSSRPTDTIAITPSTSTTNSIVPVHTPISLELLTPTPITLPIVPKPQPVSPLSSIYWIGGVTLLGGISLTWFLFAVLNHFNGNSNIQINRIIFRKILSSAVIFIVLIGLAFFPPSFIDLQWIAVHEKRSGILSCWIIIVIALTYTVAVPKHWKYTLGTVAFSAIIALTQII